MQAAGPGGTAIPAHAWTGLGTSTDSHKISPFCKTCLIRINKSSGQGSQGVLQPQVGCRVLPPDPHPQLFPSGVISRRHLPAGPQEPGCQPGALTGHPSRLRTGLGVSRPPRFYQPCQKGKSARGPRPQAVRASHPLRPQDA